MSNQTDGGSPAKVPSADEIFDASKGNGMLIVVVPASAETDIRITIQRHTAEDAFAIVNDDGDGVFLEREDENDRTYRLIAKELDHSREIKTRWTKGDGTPFPENYFNAPKQEDGKPLYRMDVGQDGNYVEVKLLS